MLRLLVDKGGVYDRKERYWKWDLETILTNMPSGHSELKKSLHPIICLQTAGIQTNHTATATYNKR